MYLALTLLLFWGPNHFIFSIYYYLLFVLHFRLPVYEIPLKLCLQHWAYEWYARDRSHFNVNFTSLNIPYSQWLIMMFNSWHPVVFVQVQLQDVVFLRDWLLGAGPSSVSGGLHSLWIFSVLVRTRKYEQIIENMDSETNVHLNY